jgi:hypothetical protein
LDISDHWAFQTIGHFRPLGISDHWTFQPIGHFRKSFQTPVEHF